MPMWRPRFVTVPTARSLPSRTGRRKLIFSSTVDEGLALGQCRRPAHAESAVGEVAEDPAVHGPHRVPETAVSVELEDGASVLDLDEAHPQELRDGRPRLFARDDRLQVFEHLQGRIIA